MLGDFIRKSFGGGQPQSSTQRPGYLRRTVTPYVQTLTRLACTHPIRTITFFIILASTSYIGLLETSLFEVQAHAYQGAGHIDFEYLKDGARTLSISKDSSWLWQEDSHDIDAISQKPNHYALVTLVFPNSLSRTSPHNAPPAQLLESYVPSAKSIASTQNAFAPISQDDSLAYMVKWQEAAAFLQNVQELPENSDLEKEDAQRSWLAKGAKGVNGNAGSVTKWIRNAWSEFVDLLKHAETLDISIMALGYITMHLTFVSLFMSMRGLGSNFWLATTTLFSSVFAFCFGLVVTTKLGVPINMVLLSEGLPFLVVTVGFEKPIVLTKAVLSASLAARRGNTGEDPASPRTIQQAVQSAVREKGYDIVRDYLIEILILVAGAASGIQGGLRQFCFLAAWVLLFDMLLLFTFYTAILCVKLEINRIKRHVALRRHLEDDGIPRRVAENVATSSEDTASTKSGFLQFLGGSLGDANVPKFKLLMFGGFVLLNVINLASIPFRAEHKAQVTTSNGIQGLLTSPMVDPFKLAENGLAQVQTLAVKNKNAMVITVLPPIKYTLDGSLFAENEDNLFGDTEYIDYIIGGRAIESVLESFKDPVLSKWIVIALFLSITLNGYLFNAARLGIKDTPSASSQAPLPNGATSPASAKENGHAPAPVAPAPVYVPKEGERSKEECEEMLKNGQAAYMNDAEVLDLACRGKIPGYALEKTLDNPNVMTKLEALTRAVKIRRGVVSRTAATREITAGLEHSKLPFENFNYENVHGACCENVIGYLPLPVGVAGPLVIDGQNFFLPMATTEGVLVASTNRGAKAINAGGGVTTVLTGDGMTRGPVVGFATLARAGEAKLWLDSPEGERVMKEAFNSTSRFARLQTLKTACAGSYLYIRFKTTTGDAMGMNMISKGCEKALAVMQEHSFQDMTIISVSGNFCSDKKPAAINWIDGRGKSVVAEAIIPGDFVRKVLKTDVNTLVELNTSKNLIGSAMAGSIGGFNAHAANLVAAIYLATGQDPAQVVESSQCITVMKNYNGNLQISVSMPCLEVGTIGGGTILEPQQAMLDLLGVRGPHPTNPGDNARKLARIIASAVLAGELSLCSALAAGHLVRAHMAHNRSQVPTRSTTPAPIQPVPEQPANGAAKAAGLAMTPAR